MRMQPQHERTFLSLMQNYEKDFAWIKEFEKKYWETER